MPTIFSKIVSREIPAKILYETERVIAIEDIRPQAPHHILIIPKEEIATMNDLKPEHAALMGELFLAAKDLAAKLKVADSGYRVVMNCGRDGGQTVFHLHLHLLAGRPLEWPPG